MVVDSPLRGGHRSAHPDAYGVGACAIHSVAHGWPAHDSYRADFDIRTGQVNSSESLGFGTVLAGSTGRAVIHAPVCQWPCVYRTGCSPGCVRC